MSPDRVPARRPARRNYRWRPGKALRRGRLLRAALLLAAAGCLAVFAGSVVRSARTAERNAAYAQQRKEAESLPAPTAAARKVNLIRMGLPDGSPVTQEARQAAGENGPDAVTATVYHRAGENMLTAMAEMKRMNRDLAGWLTIEGVLDLPVVYRDNSWYLNHDFEGNRNPVGTLFLDEGSPVTERTQNLLIHGHNMKDGSMFAQLTHYRDREWWKKHSFVTFSTLWEKEYYEVFAVMDVPDRAEEAGYINYFSHASFASDAEFSAWVGEVRKRALFPSGLSVRPEDSLLTLSTCIGDRHLVVVGRRVGQ